MRTISVGLCALALASCGGGGGNAGSVPNSSGSGNAASIALTFSSATLPASTPAGSGVTVTALVKDSNNNGLGNVTVTFSSDSGLITTAATPAVTNSSGIVTAVIGTGGNSTPRTINVTATAGGQTAKGTVQVTAAQPTLQLLFSSPTLPSSGASGTQVTITALVEDANNNSLAGVPVTFAADSGVLTVTQGTSDSNGHATATLATAGNQTNRTINVTASENGISTKASVLVTGTTVTPTSAPSSLTIGVSAKFVFTVTDSAGVAVVGTPVTFKSAAGNPVTADAADASSGGSLVTGANGQVTLDVTPTASGTDTLTVNAAGASAGASFTTTSLSLSVNLVDQSTGAIVSAMPQPLVEYTSSSCIQVNATYSSNGVGTSGAALVTTSRGVLYTDKACTVPLGTGTEPFSSSGNMTPVYLSSPNSGTATVTVTVQGGGPMQAASVYFNAKLTPQSNITLTANPSHVLPNPTSACTNLSVLTATVRDGTSGASGVINNLVQGVPVQFTLVSDPSGGTISTPVVVTQANGQAQTNYCPGSGTTPENGVVVSASFQAPGITITPATNQTASATLTVAGQAVFVSMGTGNTVDTTETTYSVQWTVFVTDSNGNAVANATVNGALQPVSYTKGYLVYLNGSWVIFPGSVPLTTSLTPTDGAANNGVVGPAALYNYWCPNTDLNYSGVWTPTDFLTSYPYVAGVSGTLITYAPNYPVSSLAGKPYQSVMPGVPGNVTSSGVTNAAGQTILTVTYPKDHSYWTNVNLTATAFALGTQSSTTAFFQLIGATSDYSSSSTQPPGATSPYGVNKCEYAF
ncbi:MAG: Ig-like domain-containing protein [Burkholderiaceae bacterium]|nr:Ig-like domain-containing protein [Burkholderiaceae bacterium]